MEFETQSKILELLNKDFRKYKSTLLDLDENYNEKFENHNDEMWNCFIFGICSDTKILVKCIKNLIEKGCNKEKVNKFFYNYLKMKYKMDNGMWSWNEIEEFDIPLEEIKKSSTKYSFI
jgi:hypothetical protein